MPTFGSTQRVSGISGRPSGPSGGTGSNIEGVGDNGVSPKRSDDLAIIGGFGPNWTGGNRGGPTFPQSWEMEVDSNRSKFRGQFVVNGSLGLTKDSTGTPLSSCRVDLFETGSNRYISSTTSDAGGNYSFIVPSNSQTYFCRAYKAGGTNLFGTTDETLVAV